MFLTRHFSFTLGLLIGALVLCGFSVIPNLNTVLMSAYLGSVGTIILIIYRPQYTNIGLFFLAIFISISWADFKANSRLVNPISRHFETVYLDVKATVDNIPENQKGWLKWDALVHSACLNPRECILEPFKIRIKYWQSEKSLPLKKGDTFQAKLKLIKPYRYANPGTFDIEKQYFIDNIKATGILLPNSDIQVISSQFSMRQWIANSMNLLMLHFPIENLEIIKALTIGLRKGISESDNNLFQITGTSHLMSISGLHVGFVASLLVIILKKIVWLRCFKGFQLAIERKGLDIPSLIAFFAILGATLYAGLAGFMIPAQRALVMVYVYLGAKILRLNISLFKSLCMAVAIVIFLDPFCVMQMGFWLSFLAVWFLMYAFEGRYFKKGLWWQWGRVHFVLLIGLFPITIACFGQQSIISPIANLIAIPWVSFITVPASLIALLLMPISDFLCGYLLLLASLSIDFLRWFLLQIHSWLPLLTFARFSVMPYFLAMIGAIILFSPLSRTIRALGILLIIPIFCLTHKNENHDLIVTFLDVGQGTSVHISTPNHDLLYDAGPPNGVASRYLQVRLPKRILDKVIISHPDLDHIGGLNSVLNTLSVNEKWMSETEKGGLSYQLCEPGVKWSYDSVDFEFLHPPVQYQAKRNNRSCVLQINQAGFKVLLTGDIETKAEIALLEQFDPQTLKSDILLVPHHGSKTSSSENFIRAVNPSHLVYTTGFNNRFGFPKADIEARYSSLEPISVSKTHETGAVSYYVKQGQLVKISRYRPEYRWYFHR